MITLNGELLDPKEVAGMLRLDHQTVKRLANKGEIPGFKVGGRWRFMRQDILNYIEEQKRIYQPKPEDKTPKQKQEDA